MREEGLPYFSTDIFLQSVSTEMLDLSSISWSWNEEDEFIPLVMPRDFMLMLNQFASSYKIPQISEEIAQTLNFKLKLKSRGNSKEFNAKIIGFSNQMNSVLVPVEFMNYGNENFSSQQELPISQLVLKMKESEYGDFEQLVDELNIDIKANELFVVKIQGILYVVLTILVFIAILILVLCGLMIWQFSLLLMSQSAYEIQTLLRIGYHPTLMSRIFLRYYLRFFSLVLLMAFLLGFVGKLYLDQQLMNFGFEVGSTPNLWSFLVSVFVASIIVWLNLKSVRSEFKKHFN
jgi:ABC-type antimicrobial peptide transport system permease subunit